MINIGDKRKVKASSPSNTFHKFDGEMVEIIGISQNASKDPLYEKVYTFKHSQLGFGAMFEHGFE